METVQDPLHGRRNCAELRQPRYPKTRLFRRIGIADKSDSANYAKSRFLTSSRNTANDAAIIRIFAKADARRKSARFASTRRRATVIQVLELSDLRGSIRTKLEPFAIYRSISRATSSNYEKSARAGRRIPASNINIGAGRATK